MGAYFGGSTAGEPMRTHVSLTEPVHTCLSMHPDDPALTNRSRLLILCDPTVLNHFVILLD
jgi:hypothetical protein